MNDKATLSRRSLLYGTATVAGAVMLGACGGTDETPKGNDEQGPGGKSGGSTGKGSSEEPLKAPAELKQAPMLEEMEKSGKIKPLKERLPENPYVVPHNWLTEGKYGGQLTMITKETDDGSNKELFYGHSLLRYLNDGLTIGPGLVETWDVNEDASEWTLNFRKGLKWSDGHPWSVDDILFWWNDMVLDQDHEDVPPDECRSGKGTLVKFEKVDDTTLKMIFDAPAPLTLDRLAMWVNGTKGNGPKWMVPSHYAKQFHGKYNPKAGKNWAVPDGEFDKKVDFSQNPECPTMNGWMLESYREGRQVVWVRNPYYYAVTKEGYQLPFIDKIVMLANKEPKVGKLQIYQGKIDFVMGQFYDTDLPDIADIQDNQERANLDYYLWDSGSGTGSIFFLNYDHKDPEFRKLIRNPKFRQAISHAWDRSKVKKSVYFGTGYETTGTLSPKAKEYLVNDEGKKTFAAWRDAYVKFDQAKAKKLLDELGCKEGPDGFRTRPDGKPLVISFDVPSNISQEHQSKNNLLKADLEAVGIKVRINPQAPDGFDPQWDRGDLTSKTSWEVGDGPNHLVYPQWLVPIEATRYAPLEGKWYELRGTKDAERGMDPDPFKRKPPREEPEEGGPIEALWKLYDQTKTEADEMKRHQLVWQMIKIHIDHGPFFIGSVANTPRVIIKKKDLRNVPDRKNLRLGGLANPWIHPTPAVYDPETFYWEDPSQHQG